MSTGIAGLAPLSRTHRAGRTAPHIRDLLEEAILQGVLPPGAHLNADGLAKQLGISHIPVREALRALGVDGWIEFRPHQGAFVRGRSEQELADLFESRTFLEAQAATLAAERRTGEQLAILDDILARQRRSTDPVELARLNAEFHSALADCSQNTLLAGFVRTLSMRARFYFSTVPPRRQDGSRRQHEALVDAIRRRDSTAAGRLARDHVAATRRDVDDG
ncbi:GntR family transcriptional regulator [Jiangella sp. DSM 45060]|uniref:GntR family transcriptional regulator n=1 Tax=Jiangella sp. DSM 45060 TaxID=1798224 RepID=UPI0008799C2E|nr:GntR family transcriptional regulator [Jiangella sp. DSM 45060]SDT67266.1 DNA-binding transcriptional regulator, GntR family [Jiangella sp. DSM 45060]